MCNPAQGGFGDDVVSIQPILKYYCYEGAGKISKLNHQDKREIKTRTCSGICFLQSGSFTNISEMILCKCKSSFYQLRRLFVPIQILLYTQKIQGDLNSVGRKGWIALVAMIKDLGTLVQTTIRLGH